MAGEISGSRTSIFSKPGNLAPSTNHLAKTMGMAPVDKVKADIALRTDPTRNCAQRASIKVGDFLSQIYLSMKPDHRSERPKVEAEPLYPKPNLQELMASRTSGQITGPSGGVASSGPELGPMEGPPEPKGLDPKMLEEIISDSIRMPSLKDLRTNPGKADASRLKELADEVETNEGRYLERDKTLSDVQETIDRVKEEIEDSLPTGPGQKIVEALDDMKTAVDVVSVANDGYALVQHGMKNYEARKLVEEGKATAKDEVYVKQIQERTSAAAERFEDGVVGILDYTPLGKLAHLTATVLVAGEQRGLWPVPDRDRILHEDFGVR